LLWRWLFPLRPAHSDRGQLLHPLGRHHGGPAALIPDPCPEPELPFLLVLAVVAVSVAACDVPVWCRWVGVSDGTSEVGVFDGRALRKGVVTVMGRFL